MGTPSRAVALKRFRPVRQATDLGAPFSQRKKFLFQYYTQHLLATSQIYLAQTNNLSSVDIRDVRAELARVGAKTSTIRVGVFRSVISVTPLEGL